MGGNCGESFDPGLPSHDYKIRVGEIRLIWLSGQYTVPLEGSAVVVFIIDCQGNGHAAYFEICVPPPPACHGITWKTQFILAKLCF